METGIVKITPDFPLAQMIYTKVALLVEGACHELLRSAAKKPKSRGQAPSYKDWAAFMKYPA
jgi:hypothetical protein